MIEYSSITDGLIEATNSKREVFDVGRMEKAILSSAVKTVRDSANCLIAALDDFMAGQEQNDDLTFLLFEIR